jgi:hypothetical protein
MAHEHHNPFIGITPHFTLMHPSMASHRVGRPSGKHRRRRRRLPTTAIRILESGHYVSATEDMRP